MNKKKIKILTNGAIKIKGFINGPVLTPYMEDLDTIFALISGGVHIVEVCDDNTEIKLTTSNFSTDHSKAVREAAINEAKEKAAAAAIIQEEKDREAKKEKEAKEKAEADRVKAEAEEAARVAEIEKVEAVVTDEVVSNERRNNNRNNNRNNRNNQNRNQVKVEEPSDEPINLNKQ